MNTNPASSTSGPAAFVSCEEYGIPAPPRVFLSLCIPTYNRAAKLAASLDRLAAILATSAYRDRLEVFVSNNASTDDTSEVLRVVAERLGAYCPVRIHTHARNLGMMGNFEHVYAEARGEYAWICSDDDVLDPADFDRLFADLEEVRPSVCVSSFLQTPYTATERVFMCSGKDRELISDMREGVHAIHRQSKITAYVFRRRALTDAEQAVSEESGRVTAYWFLTLAVLLFVREPRLLVRSANIARCDTGYLDMRFSTRVMSTLHESVLLGLEEGEIKDYFRANMVAMDAGPWVVGCLFRHAVGLSNVDETVVREDFKYVRANVGTLMRGGWRTRLKLPFVLALIPIVTRVRSLTGSSVGRSGASDPPQGRLC